MSRCASVTRTIRAVRGAGDRSKGRRTRGQSQYELFFGLASDADRYRLAGHLADLLAGPSPRPPHADLDDVVGQEQLERPIDGNPDAAIEARQSEQVIAAPEEPRDESGDLDPEDLADAFEAA